MTPSCFSVYPEPNIIQCINKYGQNEMISIINISSSYHTSIINSTILSMGFHCYFYVSSILLAHELLKRCRISISENMSWLEQCMDT